MEINVRKWLLIFAVIIGLIIYVKDHYTVEDALAYSKRHPDPVFSPKVDYYVGMVHYLRSEYPESASAFEQLLTDYPTCQYVPRTLLRLGSVYTEQGKWEQARGAYQRYMEEYPKEPDIDLVQKKYEYIKFR